MAKQSLKACATWQWVGGCMGGSQKIFSNLASDESCRFDLFLMFCNLPELKFQ